MFLKECDNFYQKGKKVATALRQKFWSRFGVPRLGVYGVQAPVRKLRDLDGKKCR